MADYYETFVDGELPAYYVACRHCGVDLYGRNGDHEPDCPGMGTVSDVHDPIARFATLYVRDATYEQLKAWAAMEGVSVDRMAEVVLREYLDKHIGEFTNGA